MSKFPLRRFLEFPREVSSKMMSEWFGFRSLCRTDSACCSRSQRQELLASLSSPWTILTCAPADTEIMYESFYSWLALRKIKFYKLLVTSATDVTILNRCLRVTGAHINSVKLIDIESELFWTLAGILMNHCRNIQRLNFAYCDFPDVLRDFLLKFRNIEEIFMDECSFRDEDPGYESMHPLACEDCVAGLTCPALRTLSLYECSITANKLTSLLMLGNRLVHMNLNTPWPPNVNLIACHRGLQRLVLRRSKIQEAELLEIVNSCRQLNALDVGNCQHVTDRVVLTAVMKCPHLRTLLIDSNQHLTDASLLAIAEHCPTIRHINLTGCAQLTQEGISTFLTSCTNIYTFYLSSPTVTEVARLPTVLTSLTIEMGVSDDSLVAIAEHCISLQYLRLDSCELCTATGLSALATGCPALRTLVVPYQAQVPDVWKIDRPLVNVVLAYQPYYQNLLLVPDMKNSDYVAQARSLQVL